MLLSKGFPPSKSVCQTPLWRRVECDEIETRRLNLPFIGEVGALLILLQWGCTLVQLVRAISPPVRSYAMGILVTQSYSSITSNTALRANKKWSSIGDINQSVQHSNALISSWPVPELTSVQPTTTPNSRLHACSSMSTCTIRSDVIKVMFLALQMAFLSIIWCLQHLYMQWGICLQCLALHGLYFSQCIFSIERP